MNGFSRLSLLRFELKINKLDKSCWIWIGGKSAAGYGQFSHEGKTQPAHRISWTIRNGPIGNGLHVLHKCDQPSCVNPDHLFLGTPRDNAQDKLSKGRNRVKALMARRSNGQVTKIVADLVKRMRDSGRTRIDLAHSSGISERQVYYLMSGRNKSVGADVLTALAGAVGFEVVLRKAKVAAVE